MGSTVESAGSTVESAVARVISDPQPTVLRVEPQEAPSLAEADQELVAGLRKLVVAEIDGWASDARAEASSHCDDFTLLRFAQARPAGLDQAIEMYRDTMAWRVKVQTNRIFADLHPLAASSPDHKLARQCFYGGYSGVARDGAPVFVERLGRCDLAGVGNDPAVLDVMIAAYIQHLETIFRMTRALSAAKGELVKGYIIVDAAGVSFGTLRHISVVKTIAKIGPAYFPETTRRVMIVNAPAVLTAIWSAISPLLPPHTRAKVHILGKEFGPAVAEHIDASQLPPFLGGTGDGSKIPEAGKVPPKTSGVALT